MDVLMPQLGETVAEGKITKWFKSAGDAVKPGDNLFEIETDKVSMEVPSTTTGVLSEIRVAEGEVAPVGAIVGVIADGSGATASAPAAPAKAPPPKPAAPAAPAAAPNTVAPIDGRAMTPTCTADQARSVLRGPHARPQFRPGQACRRHRGDAAGAAARRRGRHRSFAPARLRPAWPHRRRATSRTRRGRRADPQPMKARAPPSSRRSMRRTVTRKCRSTACARPSPRG